MGPCVPLAAGWEWSSVRGALAPLLNEACGCSTPLDAARVPPAGAAGSEAGTRVPLWDCLLARARALWAVCPSVLSRGVLGPQLTTVLSRDPPSPAPGSSPPGSTVSSAASSQGL